MVLLILSVCSQQQQQLQAFLRQVLPQSPTVNTSLIFLERPCLEHCRGQIISPHSGHRSTFSMAAYLFQVQQPLVSA
jgi:hypothetical protein